MILPKSEELTVLKLMSIGGSGEFPGSLVHFKLTGEGFDARFLTEHFRPIGPNHKELWSYLFRL